MTGYQTDDLVGRQISGRKYYKQILAMQDNLFLRAMREQEDNAKAASCARAWEVLEERKRIMRGRLKPGSINESRKAASQPDKRRRRSDDDVKPIGPVEPKRDEPVEPAKSETVEPRTEPNQSDPAPSPIVQADPRTAQPDPTSPTA